MFSFSSSTSPFRLVLQPLTLQRSSSASTQLMHDMPATPTHEAARHRADLTAAAATSHPPPPPSSHPLTISSAASSMTSPPSPPIPSASPSASSSPSPSPSAAVRVRGWLSALVLPCFSHKSTRLLFSLILVTFNLILLYFTGFSFYLTHFLAATTTTTTGEESSTSSTSASCASFPLSIFLVFIFFRSLCELLLVAIRIREPSMWVNQRPQMQRHQRFFHLIHFVLYAFSAVFLCFGFTWLTSEEADSCAPLSTPLVASILAWELLSVVTPLAVLCGLSALYPPRSLSLFCPYIPLTSETFTASAEKTGLSRAELASLPSSVYTQGRWSDEDRKCSICLCDIEVGERVRELECRHHFHQPCVDSWMTQRATCPLCVRKVSAVRGSKLRQWRLSLSRTRRQPSTTTQTSQRHDVDLSVSRSAHHRDGALSELEVDQALEMV